MGDEKLTKIEETEAYETVQIPKVTADFIEKQPSLSSMNLLTVLLWKP